MTTPGDDPVREEREKASVPTLETFTVESLKELVGKIRNDDPYREYFTIDGHVRDKMGGGVGTLYALQTIAQENRYLEGVFNSLPVLQRREVLRPVADIVAGYVVEYVHHDDLRSWLVNLDWKRDIEPVNPDWYEATTWPENQFEPVEVQVLAAGEDDAVNDPKAKGFKISKVDLWWRMFWRRRGEAIFNAAKAAVAAQLSEQSATVR